MLAFLERIFPFAFPILWIGGTMALFVLACVMANEHARRFDPVDGVPHPMYSGMRPPKVRRAIEETRIEKPGDPAREALRRAEWRRLRYTVWWGLGFPLLVFEVAAALAATGHGQEQ